MISGFIGSVPRIVATSFLLSRPTTATETGATVNGWYFTFVYSVCVVRALASLRLFWFREGNLPFFCHLVRILFRFLVLFVRDRVQYAFKDDRVDFRLTGLDFRLFCFLFAVHGSFLRFTGFLVRFLLHLVEWFILAGYFKFFLFDNERDEEDQGLRLVRALCFLFLWGVVGTTGIFFCCSASRFVGFNRRSVRRLAIVEGGGRHSVGFLSDFFRCVL